MGNNNNNVLNKYKFDNFVKFEVACLKLQSYAKVENSILFKLR